MIYQQEKNELKPQMNTTAKGSRQEKKCSDYLEQLGYIVWKTYRNKFQNLDMFGLFDVVALHPRGCALRFIQVKSNRCDKKTRDKIKAFKLPKFCHKEIWIWKDRKGWAKEFYPGRLVEDLNEGSKVNENTKEIS